MDKNFLEQLKNKVEAGELKQLTPREVFLKYYLLWLYVIFGILFSSVTLGRILFVLDTSDMPIWHHLYPSFLHFCVATFPYLSFALSVIFIWLAADRVRKTEFGYRYTWKFVLSISIFLSLLGGILLYSLGMGALYNLMENKKERNQIWQSPTNGRMVGEVRMIATSSFEMTDDSGVTWVVMRGSLTKGQQNIATDSQVKVVGFEYATSTNPKQFIACVILPADGRPVSREIKERFFNQQTKSNLTLPSSVIDDKDKQYVFDRCVEVLEKGRSNVPPPPCCGPKKSNQKNFETK